MGDDGKIVIRKMDARGAEHAAELEKTCFSSPWSFDSIMEEANSQNSYFIYAEYMGAFAGHTGMITVLDEAQICNVAVCPDVRRKGVAVAMLSELERYARENGISVMYLEVRKNNSPARALYEKLGYECVGVRKNHYACPRDDGMLYNKDLNKC